MKDILIKKKEGKWGRVFSIPVGKYVREKSRKEFESILYSILIPEVQR